MVTTYAGIETLDFNLRHTSVPKCQLQLSTWAGYIYDRGSQDSANVAQSSIAQSMSSPAGRNLIAREKKEPCGGGDHLDILLTAPTVKLPAKKGWALTPNLIRLSKVRM